MRQAALVFCIAFLAGCGLIGGGLESRAVAYYNYMVGRSPQTPYSSFLSPAYRKAFARDALATIDDAMSQGRKANERYPATASDHVFLAQKANFAYSTVSPELGPAYRSLMPIRWVKAGMRWYIYLGTDAEIVAYGPFPPDLVPHEPVEEEIEGMEEPTAESAPAS